jgi:hypothetical protein
MTRDDIIRWARSAIRLSADGTNLMGFDQEKTILDRYEFLCWFASNVATDVRKEEREACAKVCEAYVSESCASWKENEYTEKAMRSGMLAMIETLSLACAAAIRARSNVQQEPQK